MKLNDKGLKLIKDFEGLRLESYQDVKGIWTIGYGTIRYPDGKAVGQNEKITEDQANTFLKKDVEKFEQGVGRLVSSPLNENEFAALVCFCYNLGLGSLASSTLLKLLNDNKVPRSEIAEQYLKWNKITSPDRKLIVIDGLTRRRNAEKQLFLTQI